MKRVQRIMGVYKIENKLTKKVYIGSAIDCHSRFKCHKYRLKTGVHHSAHLQASYNKYGLDNFEFILIEKVDNFINLREREQVWMDFYQSYNPENGYNVARFAEHAAIGLIPWNKDSWKSRVTEEQLVSDYLSGLSTADLESKYHVSLAIIGKVLRKAGVTRTLSEAMKLYDKRNPQVKTFDVKKHNKEYYQAHKDVIIAKVEQWEKEHPGSALARAKRQYESNKNEILAAYKEEYKNNPLTISDKFSLLKSRAKKNSFKVLLNIDEFAVLISNPCYFCGQDLLWSRGTCTLRKDFSLDFSLDNLNPCCGSCSVKYRFHQKNVPTRGTKGK